MLAAARRGGVERAPATLLWPSWWTPGRIRHNLAHAAISRSWASWHGPATSAVMIHNRRSINWRRQSWPVPRAALSLGERATGSSPAYFDVTSDGRQLRLVLAQRCGGRLFRAERSHETAEVSGTGKHSSSRLAEACRLGLGYRARCLWSRRVPNTSISVVLAEQMRERGRPGATE